MSDHVSDLLSSLHTRISRLESLNGRMIKQRPHLLPKIIASIKSIGYTLKSSANAFPLVYHRVYPVFGENEIHLKEFSRTLVTLTSSKHSAFLDVWTDKQSWEDQEHRVLRALIPQVEESDDELDLY